MEIVTTSNQENQKEPKTVTTKDLDFCTTFSILLKTYKAPTVEPRKDTIYEEIGLEDGAAPSIAEKVQDKMKVVSKGKNHTITLTQQEDLLRAQRGEDSIDSISKNQAEFDNFFEKIHEGKINKRRSQKKISTSSNGHSFKSRFELSERGKKLRSKFSNPMTRFRGRTDDFTTANRIVKRKGVTSQKVMKKGYRIDKKQSTLFFDKTEKKQKKRSKTSFNRLPKTRTQVSQANKRTFNRKGIKEVVEKNRKLRESDARLRRRDFEEDSINVNIQEEPVRLGYGSDRKIRVIPK
jgi:hypothetical protein